MKKPSLLYIANVRMPTEKGHAVQIMNMCASFAECGVDVTLLVPHRKTPITADPFDYYDVPRTFKIARIFSLDIASRGWWSYWLDTFVFSLGAAFYALRRNPDTIYSRDSFPLAFISFVRRRGLVFEVHTVRQGFSLARVFKVARIVTITKAIRDTYAKRFGMAREAWVVEPTGVALRRFEGLPGKLALRSTYGIDRAAFVIGYAGKLTTMGEEKGITDLFKAFALLAQTIPGVRLLVVGANVDEVPRLIEAARMLAIPEEALVLVGHVENAEVAKYLVTCDALVMNYPNMEHYARYMSPFKLFEYMASGVPFVTTDLPSIREVADETMASFVPPGDHGALAHALHDIARDPARASERARLARIAVAHYDWPARAARILAFVMEPSQLGRKDVG